MVEGDLRRDPKDEARNHVHRRQDAEGQKGGRHCPHAPRLLGEQLRLGTPTPQSLGLAPPKAIWDITKGLTTTTAVFVVFSANMRGERREGKDAPTKTHKAPEKIEA